MLIRSFVDDDWPAIHPMFARIVAAGDSYAYPDGLSSHEARDLWVARPPGATVVAADARPAGTTPAGAEVIGTATMGPVRPGRGAHIATASFMVSPENRGCGVGRALGEHVIGWAHRNGYRGIQFNAVVETNTAAVALWQDLGFEILATIPAAFDHRDHGLVGLHVMFLDLAR